MADIAGLVIASLGVLGASGWILRWLNRPRLRVWVPR
jgi:hypothetical protein